MMWKTLTELRKMAEAEPGPVRICIGCNFAFDAYGSRLWSVDECPVCRNVSYPGEVLSLKVLDGDKWSFCVLQSGEDFEDARGKLEHLKARNAYWKRRHAAIKQAMEQG